MKTFKDLVESVGSPASDQKTKKDDEKEVKGFKPRSKGEEDFANSHTVNKTNHPVAEPSQHTGDRRGPKSDAGEDHEGHEKKGEGQLKTYDQFKKMGGFGKSSYRRQDRTDGDRAAVMQGSSKVKEETEIDEDYKAQQKKYKADAVAQAKRIVSYLQKMTPDYDCKYTARQLEDIADGLENRVENQKKYPMEGSAVEQPTVASEDTQMIDEAFKLGSLKLKSGETVKVTEQIAKLLNNAFKQLNKSNQKRMQVEAMKDAKSFKAMVQFAQNV